MSSRVATAVVVGVWIVLSVSSAAQEGALPFDIPVYALCGEGAPPGSGVGVYTTRIEITMVREDGDHGEIIVSPGIVAGEVNPGETIVVDCDDILQGRESFFGFLMIQLFPGDAFSVRVTYGVSQPEDGSATGPTMTW